MRLSSSGGQHSTGGAGRLEWRREGKDTVLTGDNREVPLVVEAAPALLVGVHEVAPVGPVRPVEEGDVVAAMAALRRDQITPATRMDRLGSWLRIRPRHGPRL